MNAAIRSVTRAALERRWSVLGVRNGYRGLLEGKLHPLDARNVGGIIHLGGTFLGSSRCPEFRDTATQMRAVSELEAHRVDALVVIGGNGSQNGTHALAQLGVPVAGIASTIDNDLYGSDITVGVDTALNVALESIDRLRTTAASHRRAFAVEVMGRDSGYLALMAGIAGGAEVIVIPEAPVAADDIAAELLAAHDRGKTHALAVIAEGASSNVAALMAFVREHHAKTGFDLRMTILGHVQRGGTPTVADRLLASRLGEGAIAQLARGELSHLSGMIDGRLTATPLGDVVRRKKELDPGLFELAKVLAR
jgi:6-phosphofructokinase 1